MLPGLVVRVHDSYIAGVGTLHAALLGFFTVAEVQGCGEIARGELMRYFAEAVWYPTALLPSQPGCALGGSGRALGQRYAGGRTDQLALAVPI